MIAKITDAPATAFLCGISSLEAASNQTIHARVFMLGAQKQFYPPKLTSAARKPKLAPNSFLNIHVVVKEQSAAKHTSQLRIAIDPRVSV
jgi:hypothetical protein